MARTTKTAEPRRSRLPVKVRREDLKPGESLCDHCVGKCCKYFSLPFTTPTRWDDFDAIRRFLAHGQTLIYVEKGSWYLVVMTRCNYLTPSNQCRIYHDRPKICREYTTADCEYDDDWIFEQVFETPEQIEEYAEFVFRPRRRPDSAGSLDPLRMEDRGRSFTLKIDMPTTWDDFDAIRWYLAHGQSLVYVEKKLWYLGIKGKTDPDALTGRSFEHSFETPEQIWEFAEVVLRPRRKPKPPAGSLTILNNP